MQKEQNTTGGGVGNMELKQWCKPSKLYGVLRESNDNGHIRYLRPLQLCQGARNPHAVVLRREMRNVSGEQLYLQ